MATERFAAYGPSHQVVLVLFVAVAAGLIWLGRRQAGTLAGKRFSRGFALLMLGVQTPLHVYYMLPGQWGIGHSLPLQLCDLAWAAAIYALWSHRPWAFALVYFWGLTLTVQGIVTPSLNSPDFPSLNFFMYWEMHTTVVWAATYLTWGVGMRPGWRSYRVAVTATVGWALAMLAFNEVAGSNYGFLNEKPPDASLLDALGPWPLYLFVELGLLAGVWALITLPWRVRRTERSHVASIDDPLTRLREICLALPETTERLSHGEPTFFVRDKKVFVTYADHHHDDRLAFWCHAPAGAQQELVATDAKRFFVPPYVGGRGWIGVYLDVPGVDWTEIAELVIDAYRMVAPKTLIRQLDAQQGILSEDRSGGR